MSRTVLRTVQSTCGLATICGRRGISSSPASRATFGFIGLGRMGLPMARNLRQRIQQSDKLVVFDVNSNACDDLVATTRGASGDTSVGGVTIAKDVRSVAEQADIVITSLPEPAHVRSVFDSILKSALPQTSNPEVPRLYIDCSTIDPTTSRSIAADVGSASAGVFLDAPMSGGVVGAEAATLTFMLGAPEALVPRATEVLALMGKRIVHLGDQGAGLCGKLANNYLLAINNIATAEAMSMGIQWGLNPEALAGMINTSTGKCWPSEVNNPVPGVVKTSPASRGYAGGFGIGLMAKDLRLAMSACEDADVQLGLGEQARRIYNNAEQDERCKGKDFSSVYLYLKGPKAS